MGDYAASKAGVLALHENLTAELRGRLKAPNVRTTVICPVKVDTPLGSIVAGACA
jgi:short-subunit dehydrogenase